MPLAIPQPIRAELVRRHEQGEQLKVVAEALGVKYRTARGLWWRYRQLGEQGLGNTYARCGRAGPRYARSVYDAALGVRREHPQWGAGLIRVTLAEQYEAIPSERTLNRWIREAGLQPLRGRRPKVNHERGRTPHTVWQIDAKEQIRLGNGEECCQLSVVDEASGGVIAAVPFPPQVLGAGPTSGGAGSAAGGL